MIKILLIERNLILSETLGASLIKMKVYAKMVTIPLMF